MRRKPAEIVEEQLAHWRADRQASRRALEQGRPTEHPRPKVIAIAREVGTEDDAIAGQVSELLHLPLHDDEIIRHIATTANVRVETLETLDEQVQGRVDDFLATLLRDRNLDRSDYLTLLGRTVLSLWEHGPCILVGHGSVHLVPRDHALKVRLFAAPDHRAEVLARQERISLQEAIRQLPHRDAERATFHRRFFHEDESDLHHFDLALDSGNLGISATARLIAEAYRLRFLLQAGS